MSRLFFVGSSGLLFVCPWLIITCSGGVSSDDVRASDIAIDVPDGNLGWPCNNPGHSCDANNPCAINPICGEDRICRPTSIRNCDDNIPCTVDTCNQKGYCDHKLKKGFCTLKIPSTSMDGGALDAGSQKTVTACFKKGQRSPIDTCQVCEPESDRGSMWIGANGGACDDNNPCTEGDYCKSGICTGESLQCKDNYICTDDLCDTKSGCLNPIKPNYCLINHTCYKNGDLDSANECNICNPSKSKSSWSIEANKCSIGDQCYNSGTVHPKKCAVCRADTNPTEWTLTSTTHCLIDNECYNDNENYGCVTCDITKSQTSWTPISGCGQTMEIEPHSSSYSYPSHVRGYWFVAPIDFTIVGLRVPKDAHSSADVQNVEVLKLKKRPSSSDLTSLFYKKGVSGNAFIVTNVPIKQNDIIGIVGARGTTMMYNSYSKNNSYETTIKSKPVTIQRLMVQNNLFTAKSKYVASSPISTEPYGRIEMKYK